HGSSRAWPRPARHTGEGIALKIKPHAAHGAFASRERLRLELLEQTVDVIELLLGAIGLTGAAAKFFEDLPRARQIRLIGYGHVAAGHRSLLVERAAERIELLAARLLAFAGLLAVLLRHHVLRELLSAVAQLVESALLVLAGATELAACEIVARLAHGLAGAVQALRDFDPITAQSLDDLIEPVAQILLVRGERVGIERTLSKLAL